MCLIDRLAEHTLVKKKIARFHDDVSGYIRVVYIVGGSKFFPVTR